MAFKIQFTERFLADLAEVSSYSNEHFPSGSEGFLPGLIAHMELLTTYPRMGLKLSVRSRFRKLHHSPFNIYYEVVEPQQRIDILHIWHGSRRSPKL